jgi:predicted component of type VI protein secretion system
MTLIYRISGTSLTLKESIKKNLEYIINERSNIFDELNFGKKPDFAVSDNATITNFLINKIQRYEPRLILEMVKVQKLIEDKMQIEVTGSVSEEQIKLTFHL